MNDKSWHDVKAATIKENNTKVRKVQNKLKKKFLSEILETIQQQFFPNKKNVFSYYCKKKIKNLSKEKKISIRFRRH